MFASVDIFKIISGEEVIWRGAVGTFVAAKACIKKLSVTSPGEYLVLDQHTGQRIRITLPDTSTENVSAVEFCNAGTGMG